jgi:arsenate reductase
LVELAACKLKKHSQTLIDSTKAVILWSEKNYGMKDTVIVYHNPRCSKSRCALDLLKEKGIDYEVVEYLNEVPTEKELKQVILKLGIRPEELLRKGEDDFKINYKGKTLSDDEWIRAMVKFPKLIERPIVIKGEMAVVARPAERIEELF